MKTIRQASLFITVTVMLAGSANAYIRTTTAAGIPLHRNDASEIQVLVNSGVRRGATNSQGGLIITPSSDPLQAITAAEAEWSGVGSTAVRFASPQVTTLSNDPTDGKFVITIDDTPENRSVVGASLAVTFWQYAADGTITDTDILFNPNLVENGQLIPFSTDHAQGTYDLQSVVAHELGHALGAGHSSILGAAMFQSVAIFSQYNTDPECTLHQILSADDIAFITEAYPAPSASHAFGSLTGRVAFLDGSPVLGALIGAVDPSTGTVIGGISSRQDGRYTINGMPAGNYLVYAHPANSPVTTGNIGLPDIVLANTTFRTTFAGGNASPASIAVGANNSSRADISVDPAPGQMQIAFLGTGSVSGSDWFYSPGPKAVRSAQLRDIYLYGKGLDSNITAGQIRVIGPGVSLWGTSVEAFPPAAAGYVPLRFTVDIAPLASSRLLTIAVVNGSDAAVYSGGLVLLNGSREMSCSYSLSAASASFNAPADQSSVTVSTDAGCLWSASTNVPWVKIASGIDGNGNGTVTFSVDANSNDSARNGSMTIAGQTFTIQQSSSLPRAACLTVTVPERSLLSCGSWNLPETSRQAPQNDRLAISQD